jgi:S-adenosylmethionine synthetase
MRDDIRISATPRALVADSQIEIVERKGLGHPDTICDASLEAVSLALGREYQRLFKRPLHYNIDKGLLIAGQVEKGFGRGRVIRPMELIIGDRATFTAEGRKVSVAAVAEAAARRWFSENLRNLDADKDVNIKVALAPGSAELAAIFDKATVKRKSARTASANDTSAAFGFAPLSRTEEAVLGTELFLNSAGFKERFPETGEDVKVMGLRRGSSLELTVAMPLLARRIKSERAYFQKKEEVSRALGKFARGLPFKSVAVALNALDSPGRGMGGVYLTLTGTSAEDADSGQVGRGNAVNGLISLFRPSGAEAAAGKNPVSHVGKIYGVLANRMAFEIYEASDGRAREVYVWLLSRIGAPIDRPWQVVVDVAPVGGASKRTLVKIARKVVEESFESIGDFIIELSMGVYRVC